jgi:hypothetical protein
MNLQKSRGGQSGGCFKKRIERFMRMKIMGLKKKRLFKMMNKTSETNLDFPVFLEAFSRVAAEQVSLPLVFFFFFGKKKKKRTN